jgi:hypothetical protein
MGDPISILLAMAVAAAVAAAFVLLGGVPWRAPSPTRGAIAWALGIGVGFIAGSRVFGEWRPLAEDQGRLLFLVVPAAMLVDMLAVLPRMPPWIVVGLRLLVCAFATRVLLDGTVYLQPPSATNPDGWSATPSLLIQGGLGLALFIVWQMLTTFGNSVGRRTEALGLSLVSAAAAVTIMFSGYASGGQLGFPLAGALAGAVVASIVTTPKKGAIGPGVVGVFGVLVVGRFLGSLTDANAALLFAAPLLLLIAAAPGVRRLPGWLRTPLVLVLVIVPLGIAAERARRDFVASLTQPGTTKPASEPSADDYLNFGK